MSYSLLARPFSARSIVSLNFAGIELRCIQKNTRSLEMMRGESGEVESSLPTYKHEVSRTL
jgi:hypothetical protein